MFAVIFDVQTRIVANVVIDRLAVHGLGSEEVVLMEGSLRAMDEVLSAKDRSVDRRIIYRDLT